MSNKTRSLSIGVTGSAGAGKSTLCALWERKGALRVDADEIGRALLRRGSPVYPSLVQAFGADILDRDGEIDRRLLGARVFADRAELGRLNCLVHPPLLAELHRRLEEFRASPEPQRVLLVDAALLAEWNERSLWDRLVVVTAPRERQLERLARQRGLTARDAVLRLQAQLPEERRIAMADHVVVNDGDLDHLRRQAEDLWRAWQVLLADGA